MSTHLAAGEAPSSKKPKRHVLLQKPLYALSLPAPLLHRLQLRAVDTQLLHESDEGSSSDSEGSSDDHSEDEANEASRHRRVQGVAARDPFWWFVTPGSSSKRETAGPEDTEYPELVQTQLGVYRALVPIAAPDSAQYALQSFQAEPITAPQVAALQLARGPLRKLKGGPGADEAAHMLGATFLDGRTVLGQLDGDEEYDSDISETSSSAEHQGTEGALDGFDDPQRAQSVAAQTPVPTLRTWTIILLGGGHFSAVIVALAPAPTAPAKRTGLVEQRFIVLAHKAFHRYTTRKKQGGGQAAQDATGRFAKSAGAQLRRYGEIALAEEVRELLGSPAWRSGIEKSERVWVRAGKRNARGLLWSWASGKSPLETHRSQDTLASLPFPTRRPTIGEALRCFAELIRVRVRHDSEEDLAAKDAAYLAQVQSGARAREERKAKEKARAQRDKAREERAERARAERSGPELEPKEALRRDRFERLVEMARKGRVSAVKSHLYKYEGDILRPGGWDTEAPSDPDDADEAADLLRTRVDAPFPSWWRFSDANEKGLVRYDSTTGELEVLSNPTPTARQLVPSTLLHVAAEGGSEELLKYLLIERRADPTIAVQPVPILDAQGKPTGKQSDDLPHRTAVDLCTNRDARDVFRSLMATHPDWYDWGSMEKGGARVPSALTEETKAKQTDRRALLREKAKAREAQAIEEAAAAHQIPVSAPAEVKDKESHKSRNRLGGAPPAALQAKLDDTAGLTPEMRAKIEREKRARAAEARFAKLQLGSSGQQ
ncbi:hypothetical protein IE81DRAFT_320608 [Ceraceosorus guamensis]|uniref:VLRF1 domain-containing protein n=1 Tax=Ceraceosorus guamensis TaxID=1522189 RepID=A0A316W8D4_9BASI|nr:hypothetical protein IE81DRAFT_320608 [Ceraceosorus guamensis]PWN45011.1 hypothetical protein IE81DRAFT_320608 [Ceraceosorus guamensis]